MWILYLYLYLLPKKMIDIFKSKWKSVFISFTEVNLYVSGKFDIWA